MTAPSPGYLRLRRLLFRFDPERTHEGALAGLAALERVPALLERWRRRYAVDDPRLGRELLGVRFPNPVGLAAGFDKDARAVRSLAALGFGSIEVGTVTPLPQGGNPRPRIFRLPELDSLRNAIGFQNAGVEEMARRLAATGRRVPLGVNLGRNRGTPITRAEDDYLRLLERLGDLADYYVLNVSSPNTPGLRALEDGARLEGLLRRASGATRRPLLVKLSPDLEDDRALEIGTRAVDAGAAGLILTNTTTDYSLAPGVEPLGGLSGRVLAERSYGLLRYLAPSLYGRCLLVSVGGVDSGEEAYRRLRAGAGLVQLYTALVYHGPGLVARILTELGRLLDRDGLATIDEAVGADVERRTAAGAPGVPTGSRR